MWLRLIKYAAVIGVVTTMLFLIGCGGGSGGGSSPPPDSTYSISGKVVDSNNVGVEGVKVTIAASNATGAGAVIASAVTNSTGTYTFDVSNGTYTVSSGDSNYEFTAVSVTVNGHAESAENAKLPFPVFTITGKISLNGTGFDGVTVTLYKTSYTIYPVAGGLSGTVNPNTFIESVALDPNGTITKTTVSAGTYSFTGVRSGRYTIVPSLSGYVFNPDKTGVISITDNGSIYVYDPTKTGNSVTPDNSIIYNSTFTITGNNLPAQDFAASIPGGVGR